MGNVMSQTESDAATHEAQCPLCWRLENKPAEDKETAERRAAIHREDTGHPAEVVEV